MKKRCSSGGCVVVELVDGHILVTDSKNPTTPPLEFTVEEWEAHLSAVAAGNLTVEALRG